VQILLDEVISSIEVVNSKKVDIQITKSAQSVVVDKSDDVNIYLLKEEAKEKLEVFSSKAGNVNVYAPGLWISFLFCFLFLFCFARVSVVIVVVVVDFVVIIIIIIFFLF
jgi:hypothetical protein